MWKIRKKPHFLPKIGDFYLQNPGFVQFPRIYGPQKVRKNVKKRWWGIRVFRDFLVQIPVYGTSKTTKNRDFGLFCLPPPKIIKNRLNFALSEKFSKPAKIHDFYLFWRQNYPPSNNLIHADIPKRTIFSRIPRTPLRL